MGFSEAAWGRVSPWYDAILAHPFLRALTDGTLEEEVFARYLLDDEHYLTVYARALATLSSRADGTGQLLLAQSAAGALAAEAELHRDVLRPRGLTPDSAEPTPTCRAYAGTLVGDAAHAPLEVGAAGVLPCFRVYAEVGRAILAAADLPDHPYRSWIDTYADPAFDKAVVEMEAYVDELAAATTERLREQMMLAYVRATRFEWMFWDAAWRGEQWPDVG